MSKPKNAAAPDKTLRVPGVTGKSNQQQIADLALDPAVTGAATHALFAKGTLGGLALTELCAAINETMAAVKGGDMAGPEALLTSQAYTLNMIFTELGRRSALNMGEHLGAAESYMRLALKAQAQCRSTVETIAEMKRPPVVFAKQANIAAGPQQVNNGTILRGRAGETESVPNKLLETGGGEGERLEFGTAGAAIGSHPSLATMGVLDRASHGGG